MDDYLSISFGEKVLNADQMVPFTRLQIVTILSEVERKLQQAELEELKPV